MRERRCIWSHQHDPGTRPIVIKPGKGYVEETHWVCPAHEEQFRRFHASVMRRGYTFLALLGLIVVASWGLVLFQSAVGVALLLLGIGAVMLAFPFATPQTVQMLGVRRSVRLVRILGVGMVGAGVWELIRALSLG